MSDFPFFLTMFYILLLINPLIGVLSELYKTVNHLKNLLSKVNLRNELYNLSPREFELWCGEFLKSNGYLNVEVSPPGPDGGIDIKCFKNDEVIYVECKRYWFSRKAPFKVDEAIVKKLIGAMTCDNVNLGIIITTGIITNDAREFINTLPENINIKLFDGNSFDMVYSMNSFNYSSIK